MKRVICWSWVVLVAACGEVTSSGGDQDAGDLDAPDDGGQDDAPSSGPGGALSFDGADDLVFVPTSDVLNAPVAMTMEAWVRLESATGGSVASIWGPGGALDKMILHVPQGSLEARISVPGVTGQPSAGDQFGIDGQWHHVAATFDGNALALYVDGSPVAETIVAGNLENPNQPLLLGPEEILSGGQTFLAGALDEVRIWDRARSAGEIAASFESTVAADSPGLIAYYQFDLPQGQQVLDSSNEQLHGTLGADAAVAADDPERGESTAPIQ